MGSNNPPRPAAPRDAEGSRPIDPASIDASSVRMSPNMFSVTITSKSRGRRSRCMAAASTNMCSKLTSGNSAGSMRSTTERHSREVSSTLALSTEVSLRRRVRASCADSLHHAFDLGHAVAADVARLGGRAMLVAEIDASGELAHHHDVDAAQQLGLDGRGIEHRRVRHDRAQIGEQSERLAQLQQSLFGPHGGVRIGPLRTADGAQQDRVRASTQGERRVRQRFSRGVDGGTAEERGLESKGMAEALRNRAERPHGFGGDLAADAVAREDGDQSLQPGGSYVSRTAS